MLTYSRLYFSLLRLSTISNTWLRFPAQVSEVGLLMTNMKQRHLYVLNNWATCKNIVFFEVGAKAILSF